jgi:hypothetical protein
MSTLVHQRCFNHFGREAVARCPECAQYFCRECITEHDGRVLCAACLKKLTPATHTHRPTFRKLLRLAQCVLGIFIVWFFFFLIGEMLLRLPDSFHEGTLWHVNWTDKQ